MKEQLHLEVHFSQKKRSQSLNFNVERCTDLSALLTIYVCING